MRAVELEGGRQAGRNGGLWGQRGQDGGKGTKGTPGPGGVLGTVARPPLLKHSKWGV